MSLNVPLQADLLALRDKRQQVIDCNLQRENNRRFDHRCHVGDWVSDVVLSPAKLDNGIASNRHRITEIRQNGTVVIERVPGVFETINTRRIRPVP